MAASSGTATPNAKTTITTSLLIASGYDSTLATARNIRLSDPLDARMIGRSLRADKAAALLDLP